jgi:hypothetical protein
VEPVRATWTDERLDDFRRAVGERFDRVDAELRALRGELNATRTEVGGRIEFLSGRFDALQRTLLQLVGGQLVALAATLITVIVAGR